MTPISQCRVVDFMNRLIDLVHRVRHPKQLIFYALVHLNRIFGWEAAGVCD